MLASPLWLWHGADPLSPALLAPGKPLLAYEDLTGLLARTGADLARAGVEPGLRIALLIQDGPTLAAAVLAVGLQAVACPLNPAFTEAEIERYLDDLRPAWVWTDQPERMAGFRKRGIPVTILRAGERAGEFIWDQVDLPSLAPASRDPADLALILPTSGTTARPKLVGLSRDNLAASAHNVAESLKLTPLDRALTVMPLFHIHGLVAGFLAILASGGSVYIAPFEAFKFWPELLESGANWYSAVPSIHQAVLARARRQPGLAQQVNLRVVRSSSAPLAPAVLAELEATFRAPVIEAYGMTEAAHQICSNPLPPAIRKPGSVGVPAGPAVQILNDQYQPLPAGELGQVAIRGTNVSSGYLDNPAANSAAFAGDWFLTGDQGYFDPDGYLFLTGRIKEMINRGGEKIAPREIDEVLLNHPAVEQALAFALPDPLWGERVAACVVLRPGRSASSGELREYCAQQLAAFKVPDQIMFLEQIPLGPTGKPQRIGLAQRLGMT